MVSSADVAAHVGVSRSTVSQILNGHEDRFVPETVAKVRASAQALGYRPSMAGRTLRRGTSDIVVTLVPDMAFSQYFRDLVDKLTRDLAAQGFTNLLRLASSGDSLEDAVLALRPFCVVTVAPLPAHESARLKKQNVRVVEPTESAVAATNLAIGRLQAEHLVSSGYHTLLPVVPVVPDPGVHALPRALAVREWAEKSNVTVLPTVSVSLGDGSVMDAVRALPTSGVGIAAFNDDVALAISGALIRAGRRVPQDVGVMGVDDSHFTRIAVPSLTTISMDVTAVAQELLLAILAGTKRPLVDREHPFDWGLRVAPGESTARVGHAN